ncbi:hypothetical protein FANTH_2580 [Fusarium anthophilum]|uniref:Uncharacterized protein n=1 Tax=Fusarium anthophilum TaxID=48485 RepID=A0A8H4ZTP8_9HYPO|nr:hypothetical protein FANTH_2580 [Fusarium anthophilum]
MPTSQTPEDLNSSQIELLLVDSHPSTTIASLSQRYKSQDRIETCQPLIDKAKNVSDDQPDEPKETGIVIRKALVSPSSKVKDTNTEKHFPEHVCWIWRWELLQLLIASGLFAAICIVLYMYSGKELPEWKNLGITLNTLISIIATFFRASIAIISSEVLSQLKWEWLSGSFRPMSDIQMFDTATRGVVGSLRLLPAIALRQPLTLEAILISFLSLGIGSFTQQSIQTYQCLQPVHLEPPPSITIAKSVNWSDFAQLTQDGRYGLNAKMSLAMKDAIIQARNISTLYDCPTGYCNFTTFPEYTSQGLTKRMSHASLGICSACTNIDKLVHRHERDGKKITIYSLPTDESKNGSRIVLGSQDGIRDTHMSVRTTRNLYWINQTATTAFFNRARWSISNITFLATRDHYAFDIEAAACILYPCIRYYAAAIKTFRLSENMVWEVPLRTQSPQRIWSAKAESFGYDWKGVTQPCLVDGKRRNLSDIPSATDHSARVYFHEDDWAEQSIDKPPGFANITAPFECVMEFPGKLGLAFETEIEATFNFQCTSGDDSSGELSCRTDSAMENSYPSPLSSLLKDNRTSDNIENALKLIATRITQEIRQVSKDSDSDSDSDPKHLLVTGNASENRLCVQIAWKWLIFPGALLGLCAILLFAVIFRFGLSKKRRIWKSSVLPLLLKDYPGLETMDLKEIEQVAEDFEAKMQRPLD